MDISPKLLAQFRSSSSLGTTKRGGYDIFSPTAIRHRSRLKATKNRNFECRKNLEGDRALFLLAAVSQYDAKPKCW